jgi:hypothetical protein
MSTSSRRSMTSSGSGRQRRQAKLVVRRSFSLTPSPLRLPSPDHSSQHTLHTTPPAPPAQISPASPPPASPAPASSPPVLVRPPLVDRATRQLLESQVHRILQRLGKTPQDAFHKCGKESAADLSPVESQERLELELDQILKCLHECRDEQGGCAEQGESRVRQNLARVDESQDELDRAHRIASSAVRINRVVKRLHCLTTISGRQIPRSTLLPPNLHGMPPAPKPVQHFDSEGQSALCIVYCRDIYGCPWRGSLLCLQFC